MTKGIQRFLYSPLFLILLAPFLLFAPVYLTGKALFWGTPILQFVPWWRVAWESVMNGQLPLWNPMVGMGAPLLANYQSGLFYPPYWIYFLLHAIGGTPFVAWGIAPIVAFHLALAGLGMALLSRRLGINILGTVMGGLSFGLSGYLVSRAGFLSINASAAWLPWVILFLTPRRIGDGMTGKRLLGLVACLSLQLLAGHAQTTYYTLLLAVMWAGFWAWKAASQEIHDLRSWDREENVQAWSILGKRMIFAWGTLVLAVVLAAGITAMQLFPTGEYLLQSQRAAEVEFDYALNYSFWPWHLLNLLAPDMFGNPIRGDYWGYANYWEDAIYIGLLPLLLAISALFGGLKRSRIGPVVDEKDRDLTPLVSLSGLTSFLFFLISLALLLALGKNTAVYPWLFRNIPTFDMFQAPARFMLWAVFAFTLLAGIGAHFWRRPKGRALYWTRLGTAGAFAVSLGAGLAWYFIDDINATFIRATALAGFLGLISGVLSLFAPESEKASSKVGKRAPHVKEYLLQMWTWGVLIFVTVDLLYAGWGLNPGVSLDIYRVSPIGEDIKVLLGGKRLYLPEKQEEVLKYERFFRFDTFDPGEDWLNLRAVSIPNVNIIDGLRSVNNFDPIVPGRYATWMGALSKSEFEMGDLDTKLLSLMDVGVVEYADEGAPYGVRYLEFEGGKRVRWVSCVDHADNAVEAFGTVWGGDVDIDIQVVLEVPQEVEASECGVPGVDFEEILVTIESEQPGRIEFQSVTPVGGWLVISDVWYPGWRAYVDDKSVPLLRANYLFRAVQVEAGQHKVIMVYRPLSFWSGLAISMMAFLLLVYLVIQIRKRQGVD